MGTEYRATIAFTAKLTLNETEIRALDALVGYGDDAFLKVFGEKLGEAYMRDNKAGLKSFFATIREQVLPALSDISTSRRDLAEAMKRRVEAAEARRATS